MHTLQAQDPLRAAAAHIENGRPEQAEALLRDDLKHRGEHALTRYLLGVALSGQGKTGESDEHLRKSLQLDPRLHLALRFLGVNAFERGDHKTARQHLETFLRKAPADDVAHLTLAQIELAANQLAQARTLILSIRSDDPLVLFNAGLVLAQAKFFGEALDFFRKARSEHPDPATVDYNIALTYFRLGDYPAAITRLSEMVAKNEADAGVYSLLGDAHLRKGDRRSALGWLMKAVSLEPQNESYQIDLAAFYVETEQPGPGLDAVNAALARHPNSVELRGMRGMLYSLANDAARAEADYRSALASDPTNEWLCASLATLLAFQDDRLEEARDLLQRHQSKFTGYYSAYLYAELLRRRGTFDQEAHSALERSLQRNPNFAPARLNLGRWYAARQDWPKAVQHLEAAVKLDPGDKRAYYALSQVFLKMGEQDRAQQMLATVTKINEQEAKKTPHDNLRERVEALKHAAQSTRESRQP